MSKFISRTGEMNGVYLNISNKKMGSTIRVTARCTVCGRVWTRDNTSWRRADLSRCNCDIFSKRDSYSYTHVSDERCQMLSLRKSFNETLRRQRESYPDMKYDDFDTVIEHVGKRPEGTEIYEYVLGIHRGLGTKDRLAKDFYWKKQVRKECSRIAENITGKSRNEAKRLLRNSNAEIKADIENALISMKHYKHSLYEDYKAFVGRKKRGMEVIDLFKSSHPNGKMFYCFTVRCKHCGSQRVVQARRFLRGECGCINGCERRVNGMVKNSSTRSRSAIYRAKQIMLIKKIGFTTDDIFMLQRHLSEYTMTVGTESSIYAHVELWVGSLNPEAWKAELANDMVREKTRNIIST